MYFVCPLSYCINAVIQMVLFAAKSSVGLHELQRIEPSVVPFYRPMQVRSAGAARCADIADVLALPDNVTHLHRKARGVEEGTVQSHAVIDHQQVAFEAEGRARRENDNPIGWSDKGSPTGAGRNVEAGMVSARRPLVDPLRPEAARNPPLNRPDERLAPSSNRMACRTRRRDLGKFALAALEKRGAGYGTRPKCDGHMLDLPGARRDGE